MKKLKLSIVFVLVCILLISGINAYFTDGDTVTNTFTIGKVSLKLEEPNWNPPDYIVPKQEVPKDPQVVNDGVNDEFIFVEVKIPYQTIVTAEDNGMRLDAKDTELFSYNINQGWVEVGSPVKDDKTVTHLYAYSKDNSCLPLKPNETTNTLFDKVKFCNVIEDQGLEGTIQEIVINAYGIQINNINGNKTDPVSVWNVIKNQEPSLQDNIGTEAILMKGEDFNTLLRDNFPDATSVEFIKGRASTNSMEKAKKTRTLPSSIIDFSKAQDESILGYQDGDTVYVVSEKDILANKDCSGMFYECPNLENITFDNFDTSNVTDMAYMFYLLDMEEWTNNFNWGLEEGMPKLKQLDLSSFNTSNVTDMSGMFFDCSSLSELNLNNFDTSNVTNMDAMFRNCSGLIKLDVSSFNTSNVTNMCGMFYNCAKVPSLNISEFNTSKVTDMDAMFDGCESLTNLDVTNFDTSNVTDISDMFACCGSLTQLDISNFNTSKATNMNAMFFDCSSLTKLDLNKFDTSNVTDMANMFWNCASLTDLDVTNFDTSNVTDMANMFGECSALTELNLTNFDTSNVTNMDTMFAACMNLTNLDISSFDTSKVNIMYGMFNMCSNLSTLKVSKTTWIINEDTDTTYMWDYCKIQEPTHYL